MKIKSYNQLKKALKLDRAGLTKIRAAVLGTSATQLFTKAIDATGIESSLDLDIYEADFDQVELQIFNTQSELYQHNPEFVILYISSIRLKGDFDNIPLNERSAFAENKIHQISEYYQSLKQSSTAKLVCLNFIELPDTLFYNYSSKLKESWSYQIKKLNLELMNLSQECKDMYIADLAGLILRKGLDFGFNPAIYFQTKMDLHIDFLPLIAQSIIDIIKSSLGKFKKCLILDLDNTTWGGIIGDDGLEGIRVGHLGIGVAFTNLQKWAKNLKERGVILAICSKNTEHIAKEPFEKHPDMVLRLDDISVFVANWENKADNIRYIQSVLNIGFDSMVFLDDNPFERNLVREQLPEVLVPELPEDPAMYLSYLEQFNIFETTSYSSTDKNRTKQYQTEAKRKKLQQSFGSIQDYLANLKMNAVAESFSDFNVPRISQLTQRSNQFNLRTIRYSEEDVKRIMENEKFHTLSISLKDKYGDYGLISLLILENKADKELFIDTWIMSCRVLKRDVEKFVLNELILLAKSNSMKFLIGERIPTKKNGLVENHYKDLGFKEDGGLWKLNVNEYEPLEHFITNNK